MSNEWIDVREKLPPDKTWVEAIYKIPKTNITLEVEWFYFAEYYESSEFDRKHITHWRFIIHPFFEPIAEQSFILELPTNEHLR